MLEHANSYLHRDKEKNDTEGPIPWVGWVCSNLLLEQANGFSLVVKNGRLTRPVTLACQTEVMLRGHKDETPLVSWIDRVFNG